MPIAAEPSVEKGLAIAVEMDRRDAGFGRQRIHHGDGAKTVKAMFRPENYKRVLEQEEGNKAFCI